MHKNNKNSIGNYCIYAIFINFRTFKIGKADLDRKTKEGVPVRIQQQINLFGRIIGVKQVGYEIILCLYQSSTDEALKKEREILQDYSDKNGEVPLGNNSSFISKNKKR